MKKRFKNKSKSLGKYTLAEIKLSASFVLAAVFVSAAFYIGKDYSEYYYDFYTVSLELLKAARASAGIGFLGYIFVSCAEKHCCDNKK